MQAKSMKQKKQTNTILHIPFDYKTNKHDWVHRKWSILPSNSEYMNAQISIETFTISLHMKLSLLTIQVIAEYEHREKMHDFCSMGFYTFGYKIYINPNLKI